MIISAIKPFAGLFSCAKNYHLLNLSQVSVFNGLNYYYISDSLRLFLTYHYFLRFAALIFAMGLAISNSAPFLWISNDGAMAYELCDPLDGESEKESKTSEDIDDKIQVNNYGMESGTSIRLLQYFQLFDLDSSHDPETPTPPPEPFFSFL